MTQVLKPAGAFLAAALLLAACQGPAGPARERLVPDPDFGNGGLALAADSGSAGGADYGLTLIREPDGALVLAGIACDAPRAPCPDNHWIAAAWRFLPSGGLDGGFAHAGAFLANGVGGGDIDAVFDAAAVGDAVLLVGAVQTARNDLDGYLWALDAFGNPAPDLLGGAGGAEYDGALAGGGHDAFLALAADDGALWIAGMAAPSTNANQYRATVWKLDQDGNKDPAFDADGVWARSGSATSWLHAIALDGAGRPVVAGVEGDRAKVWRLQTTGGTDPDFQGGVVELAVPGATKTFARAVLVDGDRVVVAGAATVDGEVHPTLWRLLPDGTPDPEFGTAGVLLLPEKAEGGGLAYWLEPISLAKDARGRYLLAGAAKSGRGDLDAAVWRVLPEGKPDPNFCGGGPCTLDRAGGDDWATGLVLADDGTVYLGGWASGPDGDPDAAVWKLDLQKAP